MAEYQVSIKKCVQVSPDDWELYTRSLKIDDNTTIGEIAQWIRVQHKDANQEIKLDFAVVQLQTLPVG